MTLDQALDSFESNPNGRSAAALLTIATQYWHDDMIGDDTFDDCVRKVRDWLRKPMPKDVEEAFNRFFGL